jgi:hypothetical protein
MSLKPSGSDLLALSEWLLAHPQRSAGVLTNQKMSSSEVFALNLWLSAYPVRMRYKTIVENIRRGNVGGKSPFDVWDIVGVVSHVNIADLIENTKFHFESFQYSGIPAESRTSPVVH